MNETFLQSYLSGKATEDEKRIILDWLKSSEEHRIRLSEMKALRLLHDTMPAQKEVLQKEMEESLRRLNAHIDKISMGQRKTRLRLVLSWTAGVVAILFFILGVRYNQMSTMDAILPATEENWITHENKIHAIDVLFLPDSTEIWLDEGSSICYPDPFNGGPRIVRLKGLAFFDVAKDEKHPFIVEVDSCRIEVLGTSFSVNTTTPGIAAETILMSGSVQIAKADGTRLAELHPGQQAFFFGNNKPVEIREVDAQTLTSWRFGLIGLQNKNIRDIISQLENIYHIHIKMDTTLIREKRYNFAFKRAHGPETTIKQLEFITGVPVEILTQKK